MTTDTTDSTNPSAGPSDPEPSGGASGQGSIDRAEDDLFLRTNELIAAFAFLDREMEPSLAAFDKTLEEL